MNTPTAEFANQLPRCQKCAGAGWYTEEVEGSLSPLLVMCECKRAEQSGKLQRSMPDNLTACTFDAWRVDWQRDQRKQQTLVDALVACESYASQPRGWLYIHSSGGRGNGTGKSHLAAATAQAIAASGRPITFVRIADMLRDTTGNWDERAAKMDRLTRIDCLVIDDLGKEYRGSERATAWTDSVLFDVLDARYITHLPTIVTSNYAIDELEQRKGYNTAIVSRIHGMSLDVCLDGDDYRRQNG